MKLILIFTSLLLSSFLFCQEPNTFFISKKSKPDKIKTVLTIDDKIKVKYNDSSGLKKLKGRISTIQQNSITIDSTLIPLENIVQVSVHRRDIKLLGGIGFTIGSSLIAYGVNRSQNPKTIETTTQGTFGSTTTEKTYNGNGFIMAGTIICSVSTAVVIFPSVFSSDLYQFNTYISH